MSSYIYQHLLGPGSAGGRGRDGARIGNDKDYLTTQVWYKLNLKGPSMAMQTACSTSLVAVCLGVPEPAVVRLRHGAGRRRLGRVPQKKGYFYQAGGILSPDGHCRAFDAEGQGTVVGNGVGIVVLKRLSRCDRRRRHDPRGDQGAALNNDGSTKVGYTAPSVEGQAAGDRDGAGHGRRRARHDQLRRGARHGDAARRSDRGGGADAGVQAAHDKRRASARSGR